eukprot:11021381-Lingulodinium_polyedra.AAC.1
MLTTAGKFLTDPSPAQPGSLAKQTLRFSGLPAELSMSEVKPAIEFYGTLDTAFPNVEDIPGTPGERQFCVRAIYAGNAVARW